MGSKTSLVFLSFVNRVNRPGCGALGVPSGLAVFRPLPSCDVAVPFCLHRASGRDHHRGATGRARACGARRAHHGAGFGEAGHHHQRGHFSAKVSPATALGAGSGGQRIRGEGGPDERGLLLVGEADECVSEQAAGTLWT